MKEFESVPQMKAQTADPAAEELEFFRLREHVVDSADDVSGADPVSALDCKATVELERPLTPLLEPFLFDLVSEEQTAYRQEGRNKQLLFYLDSISQRGAENEPVQRRAVVLGIEGAFVEEVSEVNAQGEPTPGESDVPIDRQGKQRCVNVLQVGQESHAGREFHQG